jgi:hypothetical protein
VVVLFRPPDFTTNARHHKCLIFSKCSVSPTDFAEEAKNNERIFHLDSYQTNRHSTLGMFDSEPDYEKTRQMVVDFLDGKLKPLSSSAISE